MVSTRYKDVAKCVLAEVVDSVDFAGTQLNDCEQFMADGITLSLNGQCGTAGKMSWDELQEDILDLIVEKAADVGANAAASAVGGGAF